MQVQVSRFRSAIKTKSGSWKLLAKELNCKLIKKPKKKQTSEKEQSGWQLEFPMVTFLPMQIMRELLQFHLKLPKNVSAVKTLTKFSIPVLKLFMHTMLFRLRVRKSISPATTMNSVSVMFMRL